MAKNEKKIVYNVEVKADDTNLKNIDKAATNSSKSISKVGTDSKKASSDIGGLGKNTQGASGMMSMFGGKLGQLPNIIKGVTSGFRAFSAALLANPIGLIITAIVALIAIAVSVVKRFQPIIDFFSDKIAYVKGLLTGLGSLLKSIFSGANFGDAAKNINDVAKAQEALNKATREYGREQKLNDATTAEVMVKMNKLKALYKDESKSVEDRKKAFKEFYDMKKAQADDDFNSFNKQHQAQMNLYSEQYEAELKAAGLKLDNATNVKAAMEAGILTQDEYNVAMDSIIKNEELRGKVEEVNTQKAEEQNTLRNQFLSQQLNQIKAQTGYWEATHKSIIAGEKRFSKKMLDEEAARLDESAKQAKAALDAKYLIDLEAFKDNEEKKLELKLKYDTDVINIDDKTNAEKKKNNETYYQNLLTTAGEVLDLWKQKNIENLKDVTIESKAEYNERTALHKEQLDKDIAYVEKAARIEKWSSTKLATEKLKINQEYEKTIDTLAKSYVDNQELNNKKVLDAEEKKAKEILDANKKLLSDLEKIEADLIKNKILSENEQLKNVENNLKTKNDILEANLAAGLITEEKYHKLSEDLLNASEEEKAAIKKKFADEQKIKDDEKLQKEIDDTLLAIESISSIANEFNELANIKSDEELKKIEARYAKEDELAKTKYENEKKLLENRLKSGLISQKQYDNALEKLDTNYNNNAIASAKAREAEEAKLKQKAFDRNKRMNAAQVVIDTAMAIIGIWRDFPKVDFGVTAGIMSAVVAVLGATQLAQINATTFQAATGGKIMGDLHAQSSGGVRLSPNVMAEGGEYVVNRASTQKYEPLLNAVNGAGNGNGDTSTVKEIIDYNRLAAAINDKKVYIVSSEISEQQDIDKAIIQNSTF